jgi:hypothetical protein
MLFIYAPAIFVGIIGSRYMSRLANFCLMVAVFQLDLVILVSVLSGELRRGRMCPLLRRVPSVTWRRTV